MKTLKINSLNVLMILVLMAILLPACSQSSKDPNNISGLDAPAMDIQTAIMSDNLEIVKQHIEAGTDINLKDQMSGSTPLNSAVAFGKTDIAKALIDANADLTIKNNDTPDDLNSKHILNGAHRLYFQRNYISKGIEEADPEDMIIISDADEIPNLDNINFNKIKNKFK